MTQLITARPRLAGRTTDGMTMLAATMLALGGAGQAVTGALCLLDGGLFVAARGEAGVLAPGAWGVVHLLVGAAVVGAALGVRVGAPWARQLGVVAGIASIVASFLWGAYSPVVSTGLVAVVFAGLWGMAADAADREPRA